MGVSTLGGAEVAVIGGGAERVVMGGMGESPGILWFPWQPQITDMTPADSAKTWPTLESLEAPSWAGTHPFKQESDGLNLSEG